MSYTESAEKEKLRSVYETYKNRMYITACRILGDPYKAEDAVHDAFIAISRNIKKLDDPDSLSTASYVIKAAKNTALNMAEKQGRESLVPIDELREKADEDTLEEICTKENYRAVVNGILNLPEKYRDVLSLYYLNELSVKEIADTLLRKESTVKQQLSRGRRQLINNISKEVNGYEEK